jgi:hypothetical protein
MQINLVQKRTELPLIIETEHNDPDEAIALEYIGEEKAIADFVREANEGKYGYYGHIFSLDSATNLDLQKVVYDLEGFEVLSVKPEIAARSLPEGAMS